MEVFSGHTISGYKHEKALSLRVLYGEVLERFGTYFGGKFGRFLDGIWRCAQEVFRGTTTRTNLCKSISNPYRFVIVIFVLGFPSVET